MHAQVKLAAVYMSMTLLSLIMVTLLVRALLALVTWVALGRSLWLFPYLLSEVRCPCQPRGPALPGSSLAPSFSPVDFSRTKPCACASKIGLFRDAARLLGSSAGENAASTCR
jgi:hypothetical protein